jgi:hypothetical protein
MPRTGHAVCFIPEIQNNQSGKESSPRNLRQKSLVSYALSAALLFFCVTDGSQGEAMGALINGAAAVFNLWSAMRFWTLARKRQQDSTPDTPN